MLAALLREPGLVVVDEAPEPPVGPGDVRIAVGGVGLCGSDLNVFSGKWAAPTYPWIMGHEAFGTIEATGGGVEPAREGELVVVEPNVACSQCIQCRRDRTSACENRRSVGMNRPGALAEKVVVPASRAWPMRELEPVDLVCVEPFTVVETALRRLPGELPPEALVIGCGAQGLLMTLALERRGVTVHVSDLDRERMSFAAGISAARELEAGDDRQFPLVVDTTGAPTAVAQAVERSDVGATIIELGLDRRTFELDAESLVRRQLVIRGSLTYDHPRDFQWSTALINDGAVAPGRVVSDEYPLADVQQAFERSRAAPGKTWVRVSAFA
jgi:threonine dehydrogenase-like Zn-dependent dehydrogenase